MRPTYLNLHNEGVDPRLCHNINIVETIRNDMYILMTNGCRIKGKRSWLVEYCYHNGTIIPNDKGELVERPDLTDYSEMAQQAAFEDDQKLREFNNSSL